MAADNAPIVILDGASEPDGPPAPLPLLLHVLVPGLHVLISGLYTKQLQLGQIAGGRKIEKKVWREMRGCVGCKMWNVALTIIDSQNCQRRSVWVYAVGSGLDLNP